MLQNVITMKNESKLTLKTFLKHDLLLERLLIANIHLTNLNCLLQYQLKISFIKQIQTLSGQTMRLFCHYRCFLV